MWSNIKALGNAVLDRQLNHKTRTRPEGAPQPVMSRMGGATFSSQKVGDSVFDRQVQKVGDSVFDRQVQKVGDSVFDRQVQKVGDSVLDRQLQKVGDSVLDRQLQKVDRQMKKVGERKKLGADMVFQHQMSHPHLAAVAGRANPQSTMAGVPTTSILQRELGLRAMGATKQVGTREMGTMPLGSGGLRPQANSTRFTGSVVQFR